MPRRAPLLLVSLVAAAGLFSCARKSASAPALTSAAPPARRVVSLAPNLTEIVFAVGAGDRLVGVSDFSDFPPEAKSIPRVGGFDASAEKIASLSPDLVLANGDTGSPKGAAAALQAAGIPVLAVPAGSLDQVLAAIRAIGARLGKAEEGSRVAAALDARRAVVRRKSASRSPAAILLVWPEPPQAAGAGTFLDDVLTEAGARNLLADRPGWPVLSAEWLATAPIEVTVIPDSAANRPVYDRAFASGQLSRGSVARSRVLRVDESVLTRPGPRVFDALEVLARELAR